MRFKPDYIRLKMLAFKIKATTYLNGQTKNSFMLDCLKRGNNECENLRQIVTLHYNIMNDNPNLKDKKFNEIKDYINENIKLK